MDCGLRSRPRGKPRLLQVCWSLRDEAGRRREVKALLTAKKELGAASATIVTWTDEEPRQEEMRVVPAWKWLLQPAEG